MHQDSAFAIESVGYLETSRPWYDRVAIPFIFFAAILCTRWIVYDSDGNLLPSTWYGEFVAFGIAGLTLLLLRAAQCRGYNTLILGVATLMLGHCGLFCIIRPDLRASLMNGVLRIISITVCALGLCRILSLLDIATLLKALRYVLVLYSTAIIIHFGLLNIGGDWGHAIALMQPQDYQHFARDPIVFGIWRAYGLCSEPSTAAGTLFLLSTFLMLADRHGSRRVQWYAAIASVFTCATSLALFIPIYVAILLLGRAVAKIAVLIFATAGIGIVLLFGVGAFQKYRDRIDLVTRGDDVSANVRIGPSIRTVVGTLVESPLLGFGMNQSFQGDIAGYGLLPYAFFLKSPPGTYAGLPPVEIVGDFGFPGALIFLSWIYFGAMQRRTRANALLWALSVAVACTPFLYRTVPLQLWFALGILLRRVDDQRMEAEQAHEQMSLENADRTQQHELSAFNGWDVVH